MNERQYWMQRLDRFLQYLREGRHAEDTIADAKSIIGQWVDYALEQDVQPDERDDELLRHWATAIADSAPLTPDNYRAHASLWWRWNQDPADRRASVPGSPPQQPADMCGTLYAANKWGPHYCACGVVNRCHIEKHAATYKVCGKTSEVVWVGAPIDRTARNKVVKATKSPLYKVGDKWLGLQKRGVDPGPRHAVASADEADDPRSRLARLVAEFRKEGRGGEGYPSEDDRRHKQARVEFERVLQSLPDLAHDEREAVKAVWNIAEFDYGSVGLAGAGANKLVNGASEQEWTQIRNLLADLCFGDDDEIVRLDQAAESEELLGVRYVIGARLLAICHPQGFVPVYVLRKSSKYPGMIDMVESLHRLDLIDVDLIDEDSWHGLDSLISLSGDDLNSGAVVMQANDLLLNTLRPHFSDDGNVDTWGISKFLYWLMERHPKKREADDPWIDENDLAVLADDLLCDVDFLNDIVALLEDKRQVVLYGPPGTGKTHLAQRLAQALAGSGSAVGNSEEKEDDGHYSLVQFHPAYSYEDFFEGFRPQVDDDGQMTYKLTSGPLVRLARRAEEHPKELHVMVIDEINRANLPRVLGELLFLLEYRDRAVHTQYRPEEQFSLPKNLWFIGTMNTADRSIALIDAAMRRRFHFMPFFPNHGPTKGLLHRWMRRNSRGDEWVARLVDRVNDELVEQMGSDHALIGPSYFMKASLDKRGLQRIWEYSIEPLIEDQFFGRQDVIENFRFQQVWSRFGPDASKSDEESASQSGSDEDAGQPSDDDGGVVGEDDE